MPWIEPQSELAKAIWQKYFGATHEERWEGAMRELAAFEDLRRRAEAEEQSRH